MSGERTRFKKGKPAPAEPTDEPPFIPLPEHYELSIETWRRNPDRVKWLRDLLRTQFGLELELLLRQQRPRRTTDVAGKFTQSSDEALGRIQGYDELYTLLFRILATPQAPALSSRRVGQPSVEPHPISTPT